LSVFYFVNKSKVASFDDGKPILLDMKNATVISFNFGDI